MEELLSASAQSPGAKACAHASTTPPAVVNLILHETVAESASCSTSMHASRAESPRIIVKARKSNAGSDCNNTNTHGSIMDAPGAVDTEKELFKVSIRPADSYLEWCQGAAETEKPSSTLSTPLTQRDAQASFRNDAEGKSLQRDAQAASFQNGATSEHLGANWTGNGETAREAPARALNFGDGAQQQKAVKCAEGKDGVPAFAGAGVLSQARSIEEVGVSSRQCPISQAGPGVARGIFSKEDFAVKDSAGAMGGPVLEADLVAGGSSFQGGSSQRQLSGIFLEAIKVSVRNASVNVSVLSVKYRLIVRCGQFVQRISFNLA